LTRFDENRQSEEFPVLRMLEEAHDIFRELAWWTDGSRRQALRVSGRSSRPSGRGVSFYTPDFALSHPEPWLVGDECPWPSFKPTPLPPLEARKAISTFSDFERRFAEIQSLIREDVFQKVVPIVAEELQFAAALRSRQFPSAFTPGPDQCGYGFEFRGEGLCGVSPELLFQVQNGVLSTMALAGTGPAEGPSLLNNDKERMEHDLVIEHIHGELKTLGTVDIGQTTERRYRQLKHLFTPIRVRLSRQVDFDELVRRLHPTAALGGWPRDSALAWLGKQEFHHYRGRFGAPFGYVRAGGEMVCVVAIRGMQWTGNRALLAAGCGVVAQSEVASEWRELSLKLSATEKNLGLPS
jgi:menaquinone-specific isochorismate synthase